MYSGGRFGCDFALSCRAGGNPVVIFDNLQKVGGELREGARGERERFQCSVFSFQSQPGGVGKHGGVKFGKSLVAKDLGNDEA